MGGRAGSKPEVFRSFRLVQAVEPVEQGQRDQRHDEPRPDRRAAVALDRVHHRIWSLCCHAANLPLHRWSGNRTAPQLNQIGESLTIFPRSGDGPSPL